MLVNFQQIVHGVICDQFRHFLLRLKFNIEFIRIKILALLNYPKTFHKDLNFWRPPKLYESRFNPVTTAVKKINLEFAAPHFL